MEKPIWECALVAGVGGMMPTLSRFGASLIGDPNQAMPANGFYVGVGIYFLIGSVLAYAFAERNLKQAFLVGIAAPAIIANIVAGVEGDHKRNVSATTIEAIEMKASKLQDFLIPVAKADNVLTKDSPKGTGLGTNAHGQGKYLEKKELEGNYSYTIIPSVTGKGDWREGTLTFAVTTHDINGNMKTYVVPSYTNIEINVKEPVKMWKIDFGAGRTINIENTLLSKKGGEVVIKAEVETTKDLLWALGARGKAEITGWGVTTVPNIRQDGEQKNFKERR